MTFLFFREFALYIRNERNLRINLLLDLSPMLLHPPSFVQILQITHEMFVRMGLLGFYILFLTTPLLMM